MTTVIEGAVAGGPAGTPVAARAAAGVESRTAGGAVQGGGADGSGTVDGSGGADGARRDARTGWCVAPALPGDRQALAALFAACSEDTVRLRFFGRLRAFPRDYLDGALADPPHVHDAVVVYRGGDRTRLAGLASLVAPTRPEGEAAAPEIAVLVADPWQRQGAGTAMITALLARARARGVVRVRASVLPGRMPLLAALSRRLTPEVGGSSYTRDGLSTVYKLR
ncbi:GNAT family N-acetyltransferase [Actinacidiphila rubida]|uniref:GNAT family N-acetyltransferase n=1 Tax=Actinacidiphila rubida TaxID=310780 RepID=UPI00159F2986|nr:GNAT family N-acetyltransferase [Actinacidiphila rubida]